MWSLTISVEPDKMLLKLVWAWTVCLETNKYNNYWHLYILYIAYHCQSFRFQCLKGTATLKAKETEIQALIKPCILPQTQSKSDEK